MSRHLVTTAQLEDAALALGDRLGLTVFIYTNYDARYPQVWAEMPDGTQRVLISDRQPYRLLTAMAQYKKERSS